MYAGCGGKKEKKNLGAHNSRLDNTFGQHGHKLTQAVEMKMNY